jgi:hypothetical protein
MGAALSEARVAASSIGSNSASHTTPDTSGRVDYAQDTGIVIDVRGGAAGALTNAELHVRWEPGPSDSGFAYQLAHLNDAAVITVPVERSPRRYWVALAKDGLLVDEISAMVRIPVVAEAPLPATALPEAFADLDLAWRALFRQRRPPT